MLSVEMKRKMLLELVENKLGESGYRMVRAKIDLGHFNSPDYGRDGELLKAHPQLRLDMMQQDYNKWVEVNDYIKELTSG